MIDAQEATLGHDQCSSDGLELQVRPQHDLLLSGNVLETLEAVEVVARQNPF